MSFYLVLMIIIAILIYGLICFYIGYNGWAWLRSASLTKYRKLYISLIVFLSSSLFASRFIPFEPIQYISGYWMAILAYSLILLPIANLIVFFLKKKGIFWIGIAILCFFAFVIIYGSYNAFSPVVTTYNIEIDKKSNLGDITILHVSDLHSGSVVGNRHLAKLIDLTEKEKPDIILIAGDIIDDNIDPFLEKNMGEILGKLNAPLGVYAVLGNHDYYGNDSNRIIAEMDRIGIRVLMDEYVNIDDQFYIAGRKEHTDEGRHSIADFFHGIDKTKPIIMMDHQPKDLDEAKENGVDLLLSGHTHKGQLAPADLITNRIFENDWGYLQKGSFHSVVSSGFGTWGPPLRIGSRSEVVMLKVHFNKK
jgi:uncharacterized protein